MKHDLAFLRRIWWPLHEDLEDSPMLIHCSPSIVDLAMDGEKHLIHIPLVSGLRAAAARCIGIALTKLQNTTCEPFRRSV